MNKTTLTRIIVGLFALASLPSAALRFTTMWRDHSILGLSLVVIAIIFDLSLLLWAFGASGEHATVKNGIRVVIVRFAIATLIAVVVDYPTAYAVMRAQLIALDRGSSASVQESTAFLLPSDPFAFTQKSAAHATVASLQSLPDTRLSYDDRKSHCSHLRSVAAIAQLSRYPALSSEFAPNFAWCVDASGDAASAATAYIHASSGAQPMLEALSRAQMDDAGYAFYELGLHAQPKAVSYECRIARRSFFPNLRHRNVIAACDALSVHRPFVPVS